MDEQLHILVVDDDPDMLRIMRSYLKDSYRVTLISSGEEALEFLKSNKPDAIVMDFMMPGMNGLETVNEIKNREESKSIPVFFLTAVSESDKIQDLMKVGQGYLQKPVGRRELLSLLTNYFE